MATAKSSKSKVKKVIKTVEAVGKVFITSSFNNTIISVTSEGGDVVSQSSSGAVGFKGSKKSTPYAASMASIEASKKAVEMGMRTVSVYIKGPGSGRDAAVKALKLGGLTVTSLSDISSLPHNGCRPKKQRRN